MSKAARPCANCQRETYTITKGRCPSCYAYWSRQGYDRPPEGLQPTSRPMVPLRPCATCGCRAKPLTHGRCRTCYLYWYRMGKERAERLIHPPVIASCSNCGQTARLYVRGRCQPCYQYWRQHGVERPAMLYDPLMRAASRLCANCGKDRGRYGLRHGRCYRCAAYWADHGREWTPADSLEARQRAAHYLKPCRNCRRLDTTLIRGRCHTCDTHMRRYGEERPASLWGHETAVARPCMVCGDLTRLLSRGRCRRCYSYWKMRGTERPAYCWQRTEGDRPPRGDENEREAVG